MVDRSVNFQYVRHSMKHVGGNVVSDDASQYTNNIILWCVKQTLNDTQRQLASLQDKNNLTSIVFTNKNK